MFLLHPQVLKRPEYFGRFGKIHKVVINNSTSYAGSQVSSQTLYQFTYVDFFARQLNKSCLTKTLSVLLSLPFCSTSLHDYTI